MSEGADQEDNRVKGSSGAVWRNSIQDHARGGPADGLGMERCSSKHRFRCLLGAGNSTYCSRSTVPFSLKPKHSPTETVIPSRSHSLFRTRVLHLPNARAFAHTHTQREGEGEREADREMQRDSHVRVIYMFDQSYFR